MFDLNEGIKIRYRNKLDLNRHLNKLDLNRHLNHTCTYIECESSIIDNTSWKMILSNIEFWRVEVDILKFHWNKLKIGNFQRFIWNILNPLLFFNLNQSFLVSFVHPGSTPHHFSSGLSLQSSEISGVTFDFLEKLRMCCAVLPMSILVRLR